MILFVLFDFVPMNDTTTADDIFRALTGVLDKMRENSRAVSLAADKAPPISGAGGRGRWALSQGSVT